MSDMPKDSKSSSEHKHPLLQWAWRVLSFLVILVLVSSALDFYRLKTMDQQSISSASLSFIKSQLNKDDLASFEQGEPLLIYVWATWCPVCKTTSFAASRISEDYPVLAIALKSGSDQEVTQYLKSKEYVFTNYNDQQGRLSVSLGFSATPSFMILDAQGQVKFFSVGINTEPGLRAKLNLL